MRHLLAVDFIPLLVVLMLSHWSECRGPECRKIKKLDLWVAVDTYGLKHIGQEEVKLFVLSLIKDLWGSKKSGRLDFTLVRAQRHLLNNTDVAAVDHLLTSTSKNVQLNVEPASLDWLTDYFRQHPALIKRATGNDPDVEDVLVYLGSGPFIVRDPKQRKHTLAKGRKNLSGLTSFMLLLDVDNGTTNDIVLNTQDMFAKIFVIKYPHILPPDAGIFTEEICQHLRFCQFDVVLDPCQRNKNGDCERNTKTVISKPGQVCPPENRPQTCNDSDCSAKKITTQTLPPFSTSTASNKSETSKVSDLQEIGTLIGIIAGVLLLITFLVVTAVCLIFRKKISTGKKAGFHNISVTQTNSHAKSAATTDVGNSQDEGKFGAELALHDIKKNM